ncbi:helix-turn-helix domain-containing protein [Paraburkholderia madseniana]|uniref:Helix-turn-helix domain-containing protein n=1 Tax=Paraburkholderia madseniana TaxID=2599607 RepID=A0A6N6W511_9BURK|nr:AraC family transcriptional regulator [Paraburkholderia madseniana]KAE8755301.1 helix-turn-helix domain-containing protein [Paraburkholderia madseniana]
MEIAISRRNRNRLIASHAREDIEREVSQVLCPHRMEVAHRGPLNAELYGVALHQAMLLELHYGSETHIDAGDIGNHYLFRTTLSGKCALESGGERVSLRAGSLSVSSPARMSRIVTDRECRNLLLRIDRQALEVKLAEMLNDSVKQPLVFDLAFDNAHTGTTVFLSTLRHLCNLCDQFDEPAQERIFGRDLTQWLMTVLLSQLPHSYSATLARASSAPLPVHVRRARDYIDAHLDEPLRMDALARAAGVSTRTLQNGFSQFLNTSPGGYIRERRLEAVHRALQTQPERSVTDIFVEHGVHSFGHFAKAYARRFGCLPSATAKRMVRN